MREKVQVLDLATNKPDYSLLVDPPPPVRNARPVYAGVGALHARLLQLNADKDLPDSVLVTVNSDNTLKIVDHHSGRVLSSTTVEVNASKVDSMMVYSSLEEKIVALVSADEERVVIYDLLVHAADSIELEASCELRSSWSLSEAVRGEVGDTEQCHVSAEGAKPCPAHAPRGYRVTAATYTVRDRFVSFYVFGTSSGHIAVYTREGKFQGRLLVTRSVGGVLDLGQGGAYGSQPWWLSKKEFGHFSVPTLDSMSRAPCGGWSGSASSIFVERYGSRIAFVSMTDGEVWVYATQNRAHRHTSKICDLLYKVPRIPVPSDDYVNRVFVSGSLALIGPVRRAFADHQPHPSIDSKNSLYLVNLAELETGNYPTAIGYRVDLANGTPLAFMDYFVYHPRQWLQRTAHVEQQSSWAPEAPAGILDATIGFITEEKGVILADLSVQEPYRQPRHRSDQGWWAAAVSKILFALIGVGGVVLYQFRKHNNLGMRDATNTPEEIDECNNLPDEPAAVHNASLVLSAGDVGDILAVFFARYAWDGELSLSMLRRSFERSSSAAGTLHAALRSIKKTRVGLWLPPGACESSITARRALWGRECTVVPLPYSDSESARQMAADSRTRSILVDTANKETVELCRSLGAALLPMDRLISSVPAVESSDHLPNHGLVHLPSISYYHIGKQCPLEGRQLDSRARNTVALLDLNERDCVLVCGSGDAGADFEDLQAVQRAGAGIVSFSAESPEDIVVAARESKATVIVGDCDKLKEVTEVMVRMDPIYREELLQDLRMVVCDLPWRHSSVLKSMVEEMETKWQEAARGKGPAITWRARLGETGSLFLVSSELRVLKSIQHTTPEPVEFAVDTDSHELCVKAEHLCAPGYFERARSTGSEF
ncbi:hypothetical protein FOZ62_023010, partial [Perkinsus olseni]